MPLLLSSNDHQPISHGWSVRIAGSFSSEPIEGENMPRMNHFNGQLTGTCWGWNVLIGASIFFSDLLERCFVLTSVEAQRVDRDFDLFPEQ